jgi:hypothetical protein
MIFTSTDSSTFSVDFDELLQRGKMDIAHVSTKQIKIQHLKGIFQNLTTGRQVKMLI